MQVVLNGKLNSMEEDIISFKVAKLAKEKGLPQKEFLSKGILYTKDGDLTGWEPVYNYSETDIGIVSQSVLQKWLREEHEIIIQPDYDTRDNTYSVYIDYKPNGTHWTFLDFDTVTNNVYQSYEEALEKGLYEALKIIQDA